MKLRTAILMGKFCGLNTVEECVLNAEMHYLPCVPFYDADMEASELYAQYEAYKTGALVLDWDEINAQAQKELDHYEAYCAALENKNYNEVIQITECNFGK